MRAAIISQGSESSKMLETSMKNYFEKVDMLDVKKVEVNLSNELEILYEGKPLKTYDCIYAKGSFKYSQLLSMISTSLYSKCYMPVKPKAFIISHDKIYSQMYIQQSKIPMPTTYLTATIPAARNILKKVNYPIIMKFPQGTHGKGVMYADSYASASSILDALDTLKQPFLIQEYVETGGVDIRIIVAGEKVIAAMKRIAEPGEERANIHAGAKGEPFIPDNYIKKIAVEAARAIGAEICAVDILEGIKGPVVIEINVSPGLQGITQVTETDVAEKIAKFLHDKTKERQEKGKTKETKEIMKGINTTEGQDVITQLDFRGNRILLPELANKIAKFDENEELCMSLKKDEIHIKKFC